MEQYLKSFKNALSDGSEVSKTAKNIIADLGYSTIDEYFEKNKLWFKKFLIRNKYVANYYKEILNSNKDKTPEEIKSLRENAINELINNLKMNADIKKFPN